MKRSEFEQQVAALRPRLVTWASKRVDADTAEDMAQNAIVQALTKTDWEKVTNVSSWLLSATTNAINNLYRAKTPTTHDVAEFSNGEDLAERVVDEENTARAIGEILEAASRVLTPRENQILMERLRDVDYVDIAKTLATDAASVRASYSWALRKIRSAVGGGEMQ